MANIDDLLKIFAKESGQSEKTARQIAREESNFGKAKGYEGIGGTQGVFHITKGAALKVADDKEKKILKSKSKKEFAKYMAENPELDAKLAGRHTKMLATSMEKKGVELDNLTDEEKASVLSNLYNFGSQKNLIKKAAELSQKRFVLSREATQDLKKEVTNQMDIVTAGGKVMPGLVKRRKREKELFMKEEPMAKKENKQSLLGPLRELPAKKEIDAVMEGIGPGAQEQLMANAEKTSTMANVQKSPRQELSEMIQKEKADRQPASEDVVIQPQETMEQTRESLDQGFKDALMYFGPRLGAMILGGTEAAEITDRVMTGFERFKMQGAEQRAAQQIAQQREGIATRKEQREEERLKLSKANLQARLAELKQASARTENLQTERAFRKAEISTKKAIDAFDKFGKRADVKEYIKKQSTYNNLGTLLTEGKKIPDLSLSLIAKSIGGETGVLTDRDIARAQVNPDIISSLKRGVYRKAKGEIPPEDAKEIMKIVEALKEKEAILMKDRTQKYVNSRQRFLSEEDASLLNRDLLEGVLGITADQQEDIGLTPEEEQELRQLEEEEAQGLL